MALASKEARETYYWLRLITDSGIDKDSQKLAEVMTKSEELVKILRSIVKTGDDEKSNA